MDNFFRRTWAEIDLDALSHNLILLKKRLNQKTKMMCVVKADAYGHGLKNLIPTFEACGTDFYAVSNVEEAIYLRKYTQKNILILGFTPVNYASILSLKNISQTIYSLDYANELNAEAEKAKVKISTHIKVDTGMQRIGFPYCDSIKDYQSVENIIAVSKLKNLKTDGIFTHFCDADNKKDKNDFTEKQYNRFCQIIKLLKKLSVTFTYHHCCNSAGILLHPDKHLDIVRAGICIYGLFPSITMENQFDLRPVMTLKSTVVMTKKVPANTTIGYSRTYKTKSPAIIATLPVGYADGYHRQLSSKGYVMIHGQKANIVGNVCMDQITVDITNIPNVKVNDEAVLFGGEGDNYLPADNLAEICGTIGYELVSNIGKRVPLIFLKDKKITASINYYNS